MLQAIYTIQFMQQLGAFWHYFATIFIALWCLYKKWIYRNTIHRNMYNLKIVFGSLIIFNFLYFWIDLPNIFDEIPLSYLDDNLTIWVISKCLCGPDEHSWQFINVISYICYVATSVIQKDWHSLILIFCVLLPIQWLIILLSKFYYNPSVHQQLMKSFVDYMPSMDLLRNFVPQSIESQNSNIYRTITEPCSLLFLSEMISPWIKYNITRFLVTISTRIISWIIEAPFFLIVWFQQITNQIYMMIYEKIISLKIFLKVSFYQERQKWIWKTPCRITRKTNFIYELNCDSESIHTVTSPEFLQQMVNYFIEDFQKNHLIVFSGQRRTGAIKQISKACENKIYGKPKDIKKRFEMTGIYGGTLDTGSNVDITLSSLYPRIPFHITIKNSIEYDNFWEIITLRRLWRIIRGRANELHHFDNNGVANINPIELENEGTNEAYQNYPETGKY